jgi:thiamine kinase
MTLASLGSPIAGTANIYPWGKDQVLKLYGPDAPDGFVEYLGTVERELFGAGLPVPEVGEIVEVDGNLGQVYERVEGETLAARLLRSTGSDADRIVQMAHVFAQMHANIHACGEIKELPSQRDVLPRVVGTIAVLPNDLKEATLSAIDKMPIGDRVCHGDFHPYNVLMSPRGPVVIDWNNAVIGNPLEDVARTALILSGISMLDSTHRAAVDVFRAAYLARYAELRPFDEKQLDALHPIVAAVRLSDDIPELQEWLLSQIDAAFAP